MSGLFGCWHRDARPVDPAVLVHCLSNITPQGRHNIDFAAEAAIGLGQKSHERGRPLTSETARAICVFTGRLDNRDELLGAIDARLPFPGCADSRIAIAAYDRYGDDFVRHLDGDFAVALYDRQGKRLILARDRLGIQPLCYTQLNDSLLFASEVKGLLAYPGVRGEPDEKSLADFVLRFVAGDSVRRTFFAGIHSVPPAHMLVATPRGIELRPYFDFDTGQQIRFAAVDDYVAAFRELFVAAVRKRLRSVRPVAVSVSGGLDSAFIFCVAQQLARAGEAGCPAVLGFNHAGLPGTRSDERVFVDSIERHTGATIQRIPQRAGFMEWAEDDVWHCESPLLDGLSAQRQIMLGRARDAGAGRLLTGHWGDQMLCDADYLIDLARTGHVRLLKQHRRAWGSTHRRLARKAATDLASRHVPAPLLALVRHWRTGSAFAASTSQGDAGRPAWQAPWYTERFRRVLRDRVEAPRSRRRRGTSHARAIYHQSRRAYHVQCMEWNTRMAAVHGIDTAFPYLDCQLLQFLMAIPGDIQSYDGIPRGLMRQAMRGIVPDDVIDRRSKGEFTHLANRGVASEFFEIANLLGPGAVSVRLGYVEGPELWKRMDGWREAIAASDDAVLSNQLIDLCGFELLLRRFFAYAIDTAPGELEATAS